MIRIKSILLSVAILLTAILFGGCFTSFSMVRPTTVYGRQEDDDYEVYNEPVESYADWEINTIAGPGFRYDPYFDWNDGPEFHFSFGFYFIPIRFYGIHYYDYRPVFYHYGRYWFADCFPFWHNPFTSMAWFPRHFYVHRPVHAFRGWRYRPYQFGVNRPLMRRHFGQRHHFYAYDGGRKQKGSSRIEKGRKQSSSQKGRANHTKKTIRKRPSERRLVSHGASRDDRRSRPTIEVRKQETRRKEKSSGRRDRQTVRKIRKDEVPSKEKTRRSIKNRERSSTPMKNVTRDDGRNRDTVRRSPLRSTKNTSRKNTDSSIKRKNTFSRSARSSSSVSSRSSNPTETKKRKVNRISSRSSRPKVNSSKTSVARKSYSRSSKPSSSSKNSGAKSVKRVTRESRQSRKRSR